MASADRIGEASAAGAQVALADIQPDALESARKEVAALGVKTIALPLDVSDVDAMARAADEVEAAFNKVHIVCNNAGVGVRNSLLDFTPTEWSWIFSVNMFGVVHGVQTFVPRIQKHGEGGHIVNTASMAGLQINTASGRIGVASGRTWAAPPFGVPDDAAEICRRAGPPP